MRGHVKLYQRGYGPTRKYGFGFVRNEQGTEFFFPQSVLNKCGIESIQRGDEVEFESRLHHGRLQVTSLAIIR